MAIITLKERQLLALCVSTLLFTLFLCFVTVSEWRKDWLLAHHTLLPPTEKPEATQMKALVQGIPSAHLFGKAPEQGRVPLSTLELQVTGIVKAQGKMARERSKAYISIAHQSSKIYHVGDTLPYGVKIYDITPKAVILENDGRLEKLLLSREKLTFKPRSTQDNS